MIYSNDVFFILSLLCNESYTLHTIIKHYRRSITDMFGTMNHPEIQQSADLCVARMLAAMKESAKMMPKNLQDLCGSMVEQVLSQEHNAKFMAEKPTVVHDINEPQLQQKEVASGMSNALDQAKEALKGLGAGFSGFTWASAGSVAASTTPQGLSTGGHAR